MALTAGGKVLMGAAIAVALVAAFLPELQTLIAKLSSGRPAGGAQNTACPLGYGSSGAEMPASHPPLPGSAAPAAQGAWFVNGVVWTADEQGSEWADSFSVDAKGSLQAVGTGLAPPPGATVHDLGGAFVMPGFIDTHLHLIPGGLMLGYANLRAATSREGFQHTVAAAAAKLLPGQWLLGGQFDDNNWGGGLPEASWLDEVVGEHPAWITRMDGHLGVANSAAMRLAGVSAVTPDPEGGTIDRDAAGQPTGIFRELAIPLIASHIPEPSVAERQAALAAGAQHLLSKGITTVTDMGRAPFAGDLDATWRDLEEVLEPAAAARQLPIRVQAFVPLPTWPRLAARLAAAGRLHPGLRLFLGGAKEFYDGSLGSRTALMHEPYADDPSGGAGTRLGSVEGLAAAAGAADAAGLQVAVHAIGDLAVDEVLAAFEKVAKQRRAAGARATQPAPRHRIEHVQHLSGPAAAAAFVSLGVTPVTNPLHFLSDRAMLEARLGTARAAPGRAFAYALLSGAGAALAHASDWPVVESDPLGSYFVAAFRRGAEDAAADRERVGEGATEGSDVAAEGEGGEGGSDGGSAPQLAPRAALLGHTAWAADAAMLGGLVGRLRPGLRADFVVLSASPFDLKGRGGGEQLPRVLRTYVDGSCAYGCNPQGMLAGTGTPAAAL